MLYPTTPDDLRRRRLIVVGVATALLLIAFITYAVLVHRSHSSSTAPTDPTKELGRADPGRHATRWSPSFRHCDRPRTPRPSPAKSAEAIFAWDTATLVTRTDHIEQLVAVADPTGESTPGLVADLDNYLPTPGCLGRAGEVRDPPVAHHRLGDHADASGPMPKRRQATSCCRARPP